MYSRSKITNFLPAASIAIALAAPGCAHEPKPYQPAVIEHRAMSAVPEQQFIRGKENVVVDGLGHYVFSLPAKIVFLNWKVDNHDISPENEARMVEYFNVNGIRTTQVRINSYAPGDEWKRLKSNKDANGFMKYTFGTFSVLRYTLFPERLFAGMLYVGRDDRYDSYTNTVHIYSDHPAIQIAKSARARQSIERRREGKAAWITKVHPFSVAKDHKAMKDTAAFFSCRGETEQELNTYPILYPMMGKKVGKFIPYYVGYGLAGVGHVYGRVYRHERKGQLAELRRAELESGSARLSSGYCGAPGSQVSHAPTSVTQ